MADKKFNEFFISFSKQPGRFFENYALLFNFMTSNSGHFG